MRQTPESISVVVPAYNEEENIPLLWERLKKVLEAITANFEVIFVDDGSADRTLLAVQTLGEQDPRVKWIAFSRNFGHEVASTAGLDAAHGQVTVLIDADLQDPPELIPDLLAKWREGYEVVYAVRRSRDEESWLKRATSRLFYRVINALSHPALPIDTGDYRLMDRPALDAFRSCRETSRFVRGLSAWVGFRQTGVLYDRESRHGGKTKYSYLKLTLLAIEAICSFSLAPLRFSLILGLMGFLFGGGLSAYILYHKIVHGIPVPGYALQMMVILFMGSLNFFLLGIIAEYVGKCFLETQKRPIYIIKDASPSLAPHARVPVAPTSEARCSSRL